MPGRFSGSRRGYINLLLYPRVLCVHRRINKNGVFTHQPAARPGHFQQEIEVRFPQGLARGNVNGKTAIVTGNHLEPELAQKLVAIQPHPFVCLFRSNVDEYVPWINASALGQNNLRIQWLVQIGLKFNFTQPKGLCDAGSEPSHQSQGNRKLAYLHAFSFPVSVIRYCFFQTESDEVG